MLTKKLALASVAIAAALGVVAGPVNAETLRDAIALAYRTNPQLLAQRANLRALDESVPQARSGLRPSVSGGYTASYTHSEFPSRTTLVDTNNDGIGDTPAVVNSTDTESIGVSIEAQQTLYSGGRIGHNISVAEANVLAGRENLRDLEQSVLAGVIQAYADVIRDTEILRIRQSNLSVLQRQREEANARFEVGEITRTDVAQAEARLAQSESDLATAQAQLSTSRAAYAAVVGQAPTNLEAMPQLPGVPTDFDAALDQALIDNPGVRAAEYNLRAAEAAVAAAKAEYMPSVGLRASYGGNGDSISRVNISQNSSFQAGATLSVPLFTGGLNASRVAQALERSNAAQIGVEGERRNVLQSVSSSYAQSISSRASLTAGQEAVRAATIAAEGVRQEAQVGLRTTLDVLNQELELRNAEVLLASARRNEYVAQALLLSAMGKLEGPDLDPSLEAYDPTDNYNRVRNRGALPWDGVIESIDRIAAPPIVPANDAADAPIDEQLKSEVIQTAPRS